MEKPILIIGTQGSGKSLVALGISKSYKETKIINGKGWHERLSQFDSCTENTDCIIIDELITMNEVEYFHRYSDGVKVERQAKEPFVIYPKLVIILNIPVAGEIRMSKATERRFDIIRLGGVT